MVTEKMLNEFIEFVFRSNDESDVEFKTKIEALVADNSRFYEISRIQIMHDIQLEGMTFMQCLQHNRNKIIEKRKLLM